MWNELDVKAQNFGGSGKIDFPAIRMHFPRGRIEATSQPLG
jgi:hypothetical protein